MSNELPAGIQSTVASMAEHIIPGPLSALTTIPVYCNVCGHELRRCGNEWECVENCHCLMIGCVPKVWSDDGD